jgi:endonuclease/exonuclease/phosphatase family metal-dependent hydrolase
VLTGDLNCTSSSKTHRILQGSFFRDSSTRLHTSVVTFTGFGEGAGGPHYGETIDFIFTSGFEVLSHTVHVSTRLDGERRVSDHRPVIAEIRVDV